MDPASNVPQSLKPIIPFVRHAYQLEKHDPVMSYFCRCFAAQEGIQLRSAHPDNETKKFLLSLMDQLEQSKGKLGPRIEQGQAHVLKFATTVFQTADDEDRAGKSNKYGGFSLSFTFPSAEILPKASLPLHSSLTY